jgi:hypothetical protein
MFMSELVWLLRKFEDDRARAPGLLLPSTGRRPG